MAAASNLGVGVAAFSSPGRRLGASADRPPKSRGTGGAASRRFLGFRLSRPPRPWKMRSSGRTSISVRRVHRNRLASDATAGRSCIPACFAQKCDTVRLVGDWVSWFLPVLFSFDIALMASQIFRVELRRQTMAISSPCRSRSGQEKSPIRKERLACLLAAGPGFLAIFAASGGL